MNPPLMPFIIITRKCRIIGTLQKYHLYWSEHKVTQFYYFNFLLLYRHLFVDAISENNPRVIDDSRARKLASDLKKCSYYETCATYGLNVERVFQDGM